MKSRVLAIVAGVLMTACATVPGPRLMALPGSGKSFQQFQDDDTVCRQWAAQQAGTTTKRAPTGAATGVTAIGTATGGASGAAIAAGARSPATGTAAGAGGEPLGGTAVGASTAEGDSTSAQDRYDMSYLQCMYANGNRIPVPRALMYVSPAAASPPPMGTPANVPPPPPGTPPPPPPGASR